MPGAAEGYILSKFLDVGSAYEGGGMCCVAKHFRIATAQEEAVSVHRGGRDTGMILVM